ncbi:MAG: alpha/beta fold hydrolase [Elusimicrobia bacterium]|nr:alpha/beta fold hydrolase [Elusimicrobiota bacterium]
MSDVRHEFVEGNGIRFHCAVAGKGPLVLLLHGFPQSWYSWRHLIGPLSRKFTVVAPDLRGYGESSKPQRISEYLPSRLIDDVAALIEAFGRKRAFVVGHDWGGALAWGAAIHRPDRVERLAVLNCPHPAKFARALRRNPRQMLRSWYMGFFQLPWIPEAFISRGRGEGLDLLFRMSGAAPGTFSPQDLAEYRKAWLSDGAASGALNYYRAAWREPAFTKRLTAETARVAAPTMLVWGDRDTALGVELTDDTASLVSGPFTLERVRGASHWVHEERPEQVTEALLRFLS